MISNKYAKANNPYMKDYDKTKPKTYIQYDDANNLYGWAMSQYLPMGNYQWEDQKLLNEEQILNIKGGGRLTLIVYDLIIEKGTKNTH